MKLAIQCLMSPRLYKIYGEGSRENFYQPQGLEKWGDKVITTAHTLFNIGIYTSPFICTYIYKRGFFSVDETKTISRFIGSLGCIIAVSILIRAFGRRSNPKYVEFIRTLTKTSTDQKQYLTSIRKYDFDFLSWPVTYSVTNRERSSSWRNYSPFSKCANMELPLYQRTTIQVLAFIATHTFALRLIYPGSLGLIHNLLWAALIQGRTQLVETYKGQRAKISTADGNYLDTMFVDNRKISRGKTLVICCEGNSGFYEIGIMTTPIKAGYSALGWNHPGFAESTGLPYPNQEHNAIDAVIQYAINELGYQPEDIVMFGWSIGGYSATWAAAKYPEIKALVLDATFDDLLPLAQNQMPSSWAKLVKEVVRSYVDLNVAEAISKYPGPVQIVRRTEDEIICLRQGQISSNRGNYLLQRLVEFRHPELAPEVLQGISKYVELLDNQRASLENTNPEAKVPIQLISKYLRDYRSTHCTPLPEEHFESIMNHLEDKKK